MKKIMMVSTIACLFGAAPVLAHPLTDRSVFMEYEKQNIDTHRSELKNLLAHYVSSMIMSGCIGAATGGFVRYCEKKSHIEHSPVALFVVLLGWALESEFRTDLIMMLQRDLDSYGIGHKKNLMFRTALIASWLAYLSL